MWIAPCVLSKLRGTSWRSSRHSDAQ
jgi:hypothetical protein